MNLIRTIRKAIGIERVVNVATLQNIWIAPPSDVPDISRGTGYEPGHVVVDVPHGASFEARNVTFYGGFSIRWQHPNGDWSSYQKVNWARDTRKEEWRPGWLNYDNVSDFSVSGNKVEKTNQEET